MKKQFSIVGDSISTFSGCNPAGYRVYYEGERCATTGVCKPSDTWWFQVASHFDGEVLANSSFSGSLVEGAGFPAGCSAERVAALIPSNQALADADASTSPDVQTPDVILVFMGINDYGWGGADAQAAGRGNALPACVDVQAIEPRTATLAEPDAAKKFGVAYDAMLERIRAAYPQAEVWCCTLIPGRVAGREESTFAYRLRGIHIDAYNEAIRAAAVRNGCRMADTRAWGCDYEAIDGTHPTALGMRQLAAMVVRAMAEPNSADEDFVGASRSLETCKKPSCIGCERAAATGNQWMCVCESGLR